MGMFTIDQLSEAIKHEIEAQPVECSTCGESWDHDTIGYEEAKDRMSTGDNLCPSCEEFEGSL